MVHFLDAWVALPPSDLLRFAVPAALLLVAVLVPGRVVARLAALGLAVSLPFLRESGASPWITAGWVLLWLAIAWRAGLPSSRTARPGARLGGVESGTVGLLLGPALLALLLAGVARLDFDAALTRQCSFGVLLVSVGFLHLMLRRHAVRATAAFAAMGLGLQLLQSAVHTVVTAGAAPPDGLPLIATALAVVLAARIGAARVTAVGSAWVSDAHDLHD
jgi:hypothetical protein